MKTKRKLENLTPRNKKNIKGIGKKNDKKTSKKSNVLVKLWKQNSPKSAKKNLSRINNKRRLNQLNLSYKQQMKARTSTPLNKNRYKNHSTHRRFQMFNPNDNKKGKIMDGGDDSDCIIIDDSKSFNKNDSGVIILDDEESVRKYKLSKNKSEKENNFIDKNFNQDEASSSSKDYSDQYYFDKKPSVCSNVPLYNQNTKKNNPVNEITYDEISTNELATEDGEIIDYLDDITRDEIKFDDFETIDWLNELDKKTIKDASKTTKNEKQLEDDEIIDYLDETTINQLKLDDLSTVDWLNELNKDKIKLDDDKINDGDDTVIFCGEYIQIGDNNKKKSKQQQQKQQQQHNSKVQPHKCQVREKKSKNILKSSTIIKTNRKRQMLDDIVDIVNNNDQPKNKRRKAKSPLKINRAESHLTNTTYNPNKIKPTSGKRMVIVDGSNVAYAHSNNKFFSVEGLDICLRFFEKKGHDVKAVVPQMRLRRDMTNNQKLLESLKQQGKVMITPSKNLPGNSGSSYDDRFILQVAAEFDAAILSNDNYRDLLNQNPEWTTIIQTRVIGYTWFKDMFMVPEDPYGRQGPTLNEILNI